MAGICQIVDQVGASGRVLMDLNRHLGGVMLGKRDELKLGQVTAAGQSGMGDASWSWSTAATAGGPAALASRTITVPVVLLGDSADHAAALARELRRLTSSRFVLKLQRHGSTVPVWLRCAPCVPDLDVGGTGFAGVGRPTSLVIGSMVASTDPYAVGARVDVGPVTVTQDPDTSGVWVWDITGVGGDSLTPLVIRSVDTDLTGVTDRALISVRRRGVPSDLTGLVVQAETCSTTLGTTPPTITTITGDSGLSGGSGLRATYAADASGQWTVAVDFSTLAGVEAAGTYRLLARCRRAGGAASRMFSLVATAGQTRLVETFTGTGADTRVLELGLVQVPTGQPPYLSAPETPSSVTGPTVSLTVVRDSAGTGTFDLDWIALVPADEDTGMLEVGTALTAGHALVLDGWDCTPRAYSSDPFGGGTPSAVSSAGLAFIGGAPRLRPGDNRVYVVAGIGATNARAPGVQFTVYGSYWPRHGWLA
jgi:hypothetical protein